ncbi:hypothetical protein B0T25DRAFT_579011 [Lasiosphaeria hispida]|uniref:Uncharacterized protein n=1 Tax=Lasiosphaeria hispida TaxID=260671 RepID=A0AAJ0HLN6_9PEZI|nr:hypothetical protein B0T25DRAFT_579011 [Lasiosphaeria hispida]
MAYLPADTPSPSSMGEMRPYPNIYIVGHKAAGEHTGKITHDQAAAAVLAATGSKDEFYFMAMEEVDRVFAVKNSAELSFSKLSFNDYERTSLVELAARLSHVQPTPAELLAILCCNPYCRIESKRFAKRAKDHSKAIDKLVALCPNLRIAEPANKASDGPGNATDDASRPAEHKYKDFILINSDNEDDKVNTGAVNTFDHDAMKSTLSAAVRAGMDGVGEDLRKHIDAKLDNILAWIMSVDKKLARLSDTVAGLSDTHSPSEPAHVGHAGAAAKRAGSDDLAKQTPAAKKRSVAAPTVPGGVATASDGDI